ncbi:hypothetical protein As57867_007881, partial [Aphanomyces stellatus]
MGNKAGRHVAAKAAFDEGVDIEDVDMERLYLLQLDAMLIKFKRRIAAGTFADVWLASYHGSEVAVKTLHGTRRTADQIGCFIDEIKLHAAFDSTYVVRFIGAAWTRPSDLSLVMEYMDGGDLCQYLGAFSVGAIGWDRKLSIIHDIVEGLVYLHSHNIIHRNIKSRNVLLDASTLQSKLFDFGISKEDMQATMTMGVGTFRWMAPEVIQHQDYTLSADIYSFGVLLSELTTHELPFADLKNPATGAQMPDSAIMVKVAAGTVCPTLAPTSPAWLVQLAKQCLSNDPNDRPTAMQIGYSLLSIMRDHDYPQTRVLRQRSVPTTERSASPPFSHGELKQHTKPSTSDGELLNKVNMGDLELYRISYNALHRKKNIGSGAFADVWLASYEGNNVAVKVLHIIHTRGISMHQFQSFIAEIQLHARFESPYIVRFIGAAWTRPSDLSLVMEYMDGGDLRDYLHSFSMDAIGWDRKLSIIHDIVEGLVYLHSLNIIHRDIKSRNVLLDASTLQSKLFDFGISKEDVQATMTVGIGTFRWMAPEVIQHQDYTLSADIYSFGVLLSELTTHELPYADLINPATGAQMPVSAIMVKVAAGTVCPTLAPTSPAWLVQLAKQCLSNDPNDRPTVTEISAIVRKIMLECVPPEATLQIKMESLVESLPTICKVDLCDLEPFRLGTGDIAIAKPVGRGTSMEVFAATFGASPVAVKQLLPVKKSSDHAVEKFVQEIKLHITAKSPFIVTFVGVAWTTPSDLMLVTELMDGDLRTFLETSPMNAVDWNLKFKCAYDIASALVYLHTLRPRIIHRDIKSRNVLVRTASLECKLADLGASREFDGDIQTLTAGVGTFRWMAPEVFQDTHYDTWADMYSFGVLLSEL